MNWILYALCIQSSKKLHIQAIKSSIEFVSNQPKLLFNLVLGRIDTDQCICLSPLCQFDGRLHLKILSKFLYQVLGGRKSQGVLFTFQTFYVFVYFEKNIFIYFCYSLVSFSLCELYCVNFQTFSLSKRLNLSIITATCSLYLFHVRSPFRKALFPQITPLFSSSL